MGILLLKGGTVLIHDGDDNVSPTKADVLVEGDRIAKIEPSIDAPPGAEVIDCAHKIISPGFVDTHHHIWQGALKGFFGDSVFVPYMGAAPLTFTAEDMYWSNLAGSLEAIDAGTTTTLDHAHMNYAADYSKQAVAGTLASGIRSIFAYTPTLTMTTAAPKPEFKELMADWVMDTFDSLAKSKTLSDVNSRVKMGLGFDLWFLPKEVVQGIFQRVRSLGADIITTHYVRHKGDESQSVPALLKSYGLLDERIVLSHSGGATVEDAKLMTEARSFFSSTPSTEFTAGVGPMVAFRDDLPGMDSVCSFGIDCHCSTSSSIVNELRVGLQFARGLDSESHLKHGRMPQKVCRTIQDAYNMGTIQGARALCMDKDIGSIAVGKKADLVVFDAMSPAMFGAAQRDPVTAIILHSSIGDIETVVVDGKVRKKAGRLVPVRSAAWDESKGDFLDGVDDGKSVDWREVAVHVLEIQQRFVSKLDELDLGKLEARVKEMWQM